MSTPANILATAANWATIDSSFLSNYIAGHSPPDQYNSNTQYFEFQGSGSANPQGIRYIGPNPGGLDLTFSVLSPATTLTVVSMWLNSTVDASGHLILAATPDWTQVLAPGETFSYPGTTLLPGAAPVFKFAPDPTVSAMDALLMPTVPVSPTPSPSAPAPTPSPTPTPSSSNPTYILKGFLGYDSLVNNTPNLTAPFGELSTYALSYATDTQVFINDTYKDVIFTAFTSAKTNPSDPLSGGANTGNNQYLTEQTVTPAYSNAALSLGQWIYQQAVAGTLAATPLLLQANILAEFTGVINTVTVGEYAAGSTTSAMPAWISFSLATDPTQNYVRVWFSDSAFRGEYDQYTIKVVPPFVVLDDFFQTPPATVIAEIGTITPEALATTIQQVANYQPYTILSVNNFGYLNPANPVASNPANFTPVPWTVLIYGQAGDNIDSIKESLIDYILANSTHTESQWAAIFPDLFNTTEFIFTPMWDQYAIPNSQLNSANSVYSPIANVQSAMAIAEVTAIGPKYTPGYVTQNMDIVSSAYKSMIMTCIGSPTNRNGVNRLAEQWPDYLAINTISPDFNRMQPATQQWIMLMNQLYTVAEKMTQYSDIPAGVTRLVRGNIMYAVANFQNVDYLVVSKASMETFVPDNLGGNPIAPALTIADTGVTFGSGAQAFHATDTFSVTGATGTVTYAMNNASGNPSGGINASTGVLSLTYGAPGTYAATVTGTDSGSGQAIAKTLSIVVLGT